MTKRLRFKPAASVGEYDVWLDRGLAHKPVLLGKVRKFERRYNLRRVYVSRGWNATTVDGTRLYQPEYGPTALRRQDAAEALLRYHEADERQRIHVGPYDWTDHG